jgi:hypothetical protein
MKRLVLVSWMLLLRFEPALRFGGFKAIRSLIENQQVAPTTAERRIPSDRLTRAMDYACVFYFKRVLCLQRSAATTLLLRRHGWDAQMVTGVQILPFESHAWVEVGEAVVNDKPYMHDIYQVLERC